MQQCAILAANADCHLKPGLTTMGLFYFDFAPGIIANCTHGSGTNNAALRYWCSCGNCKKKGWVACQVRYSEVCDYNQKKIELNAFITVR